MSDPINSPSHYESGNEPACIRFTRYMSFNMGNAFKYLYRYGRKDGVAATQDHGKAEWYINDEIVRLSEIQKSWWRKSVFNVIVWFTRGAMTADVYDLAPNRSAVCIRSLILIGEAQSAYISERLELLVAVKKMLINARPS